MIGTDLFGNQTEYRHDDTAKHGRNARKNGYAAAPGSGPDGEKCKTCEHYCRVHYHAGVFLKCAVVKWRWTHGSGTDIKANSPACKYWLAEQPSRDTSTNG